ncbi:uncharacterized protein PAC_13642 [Phialocephala subalpina]|uniref:Uncharacterized protein n=1 Tax=Phialocephala subalpina TaxID=576137 RepID=A0A1L7XFC4_9HELO|nr:uncharacterized protein PAC_13642 [Phialocephala subalpina]
MAANVIPLNADVISVINVLDLDGLYRSLKGSELVEQHTFQVFGETLSIPADTPMVIDEERAQYDNVYNFINGVYEPAKRDAREDQYPFSTISEAVADPGHASESPISQSTDQLTDQ